MITMEQIDEMRKRTNCSYQEAKELLEKNNGDLIDAIVEFEKNHGHNSQAKSEKNSGSEKKSGTGQKIKELIHKGFTTRFVIEKDENIILNIPVNILILAVLVTIPMFWLWVVIFIAIYAMGYRIRIRKHEGKEVDINEVVDGISSKVKAAADKMREKPVEKDQHSASNQNNNVTAKKTEDGYNEVTIE